MKKRFLILGICIIAIALTTLALLVSQLNGIIPANADTVSVVIVHTNDIHGRVQEENSVAMGYAHMAAKVKEIRETNENVLLLDAGDTFQGSSAASLSKGQSIVSIMNSMNYDAMVAGNHDFGYGWQRLCELSELADFPMLSANTLGHDGKQLFQSFTIKKLNGVRIGIFGLTTPETLNKTHPLYVEGLTFADPVQEAKKIVKTLRDECDLIVALVHLPLKDTEDSCERLAEEVEGIDVIVSGHSHIALEKGMDVNGTCIVQTGEYGRNLGIVNIELKKRTPVEIKASLYSPVWPETDSSTITETDKPAFSETGLQKDENVQSLIAEHEKENEKILSQVIGRTEVLLDGERERVRTEETNLGNLIAKAMLEATGADAAIMNGGGIRTSIKAGEITRRDILNVLPFNNVVILKEIKGSVILQALEHGVSAYPEVSGRYPQVAGVTFSFASDRKPGSRLTNVTIAGGELDPEKMYKIALNDFNASGGDGYTMLEKGRVLGEFGALDNIVAEYVQKNFK